MRLCRGVIAACSGPDPRAPARANASERGTVEVSGQLTLLPGRDRITGHLPGVIQLRVPIERRKGVLQGLIVTGNREGRARTMQCGLRTGHLSPVNSRGSSVEAAGQAYDTGQQHQRERAHVVENLSERSRVS